MKHWLQRNDFDWKKNHGFVKWKQAHQKDQETFQVPMTKGTLTHQYTSK